jgi:hypothetical protein
MIRTRVDQVGKAELPNMSKPLEGRGIQEFQDRVRDFDIAMHRVLDDLHLVSLTQSFNRANKGIE